MYRGIAVLPFQPPVSPMLARLSREIPLGGHFVYEPKWDGFRCIVFRDGDDVTLDSRNERPLTRYFPELAEPLRASLPERCVVDGEIVIAGASGLDFDALLQRLHPAASRVKLLSEQTPASFVAFDLLAVGDDDLRSEPFSSRRASLVAALAQTVDSVHLTPSTTDPDVAQEWFSRFEGAGLDGVVAKDVATPYLEGQRSMIKVKHERTADCVVGGFRWHTREGVGSLLLGLFDDEVLHRVGVCSSFSAKRRAELVEELEPFRLPTGSPHPWIDAAPSGAGGRPSDAPSRWNQGRVTSWEPLVPTLVCEVAFDHLQGDRFRHATSFRRWRPDRRAESCRYDQLDSAVPVELREIFG